MVLNPKNSSHEVHNELTPMVRNGVHLMALKNFSLYPESNSIRIQSLDNFYQWLLKYLEDHEALRLTVEKDRLMYFSDVAYQDKPDEMPMAAPLFRDGIQWFEFQEDLNLDELNKFVTLISRFRVLKDEAEDDLATCLWEAELPHIKHKTADEFWEIDPMLEINALKSIIDSSDEPNVSDIAAHIEAGSKTVGLVLEAFNRVDKKPKAVQQPPAGDSGAGMTPGQGGLAGQKVNLEQVGASFDGSPQKPDGHQQPFDLAGALAPEAGVPTPEGQMVGGPQGGGESGTPYATQGGYNQPQPGPQSLSAGPAGLGQAGPAGPL